ncbi:MAG TPA: diguanylate cyclase [Solirubrobacteraceae bacterium]|nr:diguanylate cyclase [Solirubrobacteraceae bacterium]
MNPRCPQAVRTTLVLMGVWLAAYELHAVLALPAGGILFGRFAHTALLLAATGCCAARAVRERRERTAWVLISCAMLSWTLGDLYITVAYWGARTVPVPSPADIGYLGVYPFAFAGLVLLLRERTGKAGATVWIDGLIAALVMAAYAAAIVVDAIVNAVGGQTASVATNLAYPLGDMLLMGVVVAGFAVARWRPDRGWWILGAAVLLFWIGDSAYLVASAESSYSQGGQLDAAGWVVFVLLALAAWQEPVERRAVPRTESAKTITVPVGFALLGLGLLVAGCFRPIDKLAAALAAVSLIAVLLRLAITFREKQQLLGDTREQALTDPLTGLGNRRSLVAELAERCRDPAAPFQVVLFDLDGFKEYNDRFGHPAGDVLLADAGGRLAAAVAPYGGAYRMGGDEFCTILSCDDREVARVVAVARASLESEGTGYCIRSSSGIARVPADATAVGEALRVADVRLYDEKRRRGEQPREQASSVLLELMNEVDPALGARGERVARLARATAAELAVPAHEGEDTVRGAELSAIGAVAERAGVQEARGGGVAERVIAAAPALAPAARLVRAASERFDGTGLPDGLAGDAIPLGARILAVCAAYDDAERAAGGRRDAALAALREQAGGAFDPAVLEGLERALTRLSTRGPARAGRRAAARA